MLSFLAITSTPPVSIIISPDYMGNILQAAYVVLTLIIAATTIWSVYVNRKQSQTTLEESRRRSQEALTIAQEQIEKSERQAQAALDESRRQSQASIETLHEQIELSKKQAQEELYNRFRPIIVCTSPPEFRKIGYHAILHIQMENVGLGVATDVWGVYRIKSTETEPPDTHIFDKSGVFLPRENVLVKFVPEEYDYIADSSYIDGYSFYPEEHNKVSYSTRLMMTYSDAFNNKYLSIFDYNQEYGWKQIASQKTNKSLEGLIAEEKLLAEQLAQERWEEHEYWLSQQVSEKDQEH